MSNFNEQDKNNIDPNQEIEKQRKEEQNKDQNKSQEPPRLVSTEHPGQPGMAHSSQGVPEAESSQENGGHQQTENHPSTTASPQPPAEGRPVERSKSPGRTGARGTAAMDPQTRQEVARKGGLAVSRNKQHMAEIGRKGGQSVSKNREHMAQIGRKGGAASRGHR
jgi:general stress protein YciG